MDGSGRDSGYSHWISAPYERSILRRLRRALAAEGVRRSDFLLDLHASCAGNPYG